MRRSNLLGPITAASDVKSVWFDLGDSINASIVVNFTGSNVVGTLTLEGCVGSDDPNIDTSALYATIANTSQSVTASTGVIYNIAGAGYRWVRVAWDYTSGTGNISAKIEVKE